MPTYEYECIKCNYRFDELQGITEAPFKECPKCKGKLRRLITGGAGIIFRGSGFYVTDYKKANIAEHEPQRKELQKSDKKDSLPATQPKPDKKSEAKSS